MEKPFKVSGGDYYETEAEAREATEARAREKVGRLIVLLKDGKYFDAYIYNGGQWSSAIAEEDRMHCSAE
jgi:DNA integrity scanning protein DisA with diadenylate cyclase activity